MLGNINRLRCNHLLISPPLDFNVGASIKDHPTLLKFQLNGMRLWVKQSANLSPSSNSPHLPEIVTPPRITLTSSRSV
jgi:hypothetical protein